MLKLQVRKRRGSFDLNVDMQLSEAGVVALFGPSGCGKTTLIDMISGLLAPDSGYIEFQGQRLFDSTDGTSLAPERRGIGYVFQNARLFPHLDVRANVNYGARRSRREAYIHFDEVIQLLNLQGLLARRVQRLSGGERQRVALARALLAQPRLLLLDEPLASLDERRRDEVLPYLTALRDRLCVPMVYVSHQFEEVIQLATRVVVMQSGRVLAQGDLGSAEVSRELHRINGAESIGALLEGECVAADGYGELARIAVGRGQLKIHAPAVAVGERVRVRVLARDLIIATRRVEHLSVRNQLAGVICRLEAAEHGSILVAVDIGAAEVLARVTQEAVRELALVPGMAVWVLVKSVSLSAYPQVRATDGSRHHRA